MSAHEGKRLLIAGGVVALGTIVAVAALLLFDINKFKANIEAAASDATGLEVRIDGKVELSFFPFGLSAEDIHVANQGGEILSLETLKLGAQLVPLLKKQLKVISCEVGKPVVTLVKGVDGHYNFESTRRKSPEGPPERAFGLKDLKMSSGVLVYLDETSGEKLELQDFNLALKNLSIAEPVIRNASFTGSFDCREVRKNTLKIDNVKGSVRAEQGVFYLNPLTMDIFGAKGAGDATLDKSEADTLYKVNLKVAKLDFEKFEQAFGINKVIGGNGELVAALTMKEQGNRKLMSSLNGSFSLRGDNLVIYGMDLDEVLSKYETSQEFNLVDLGAFFVAGPLSSFAVRGYRSGDLYNQTRGGQGTITHFNSHWLLKDGVADATDCALATHHNRIALTGKLDLVNERYDNVVVALLDDKGCAKFQQGISGSFRKPKINAVSTAEYLAGPFFNLYRQVKRFVQGGPCKVIYNGSVRHPPG